MTQLDTRPARTDWTSRECASIFCALIVAAGPHCDVQALRQVVRAWCAVVSNAPMPDEFTVTAEQDTPALRASAALIGSVFGALLDCSESGACVDALKWCVEHDEVWTGTTN